MSRTSLPQSADLVLVVGDRHVVYGDVAGGERQRRRRAGRNGTTGGAVERQLRRPPPRRRRRSSACRPRSARPVACRRSGRWRSRRSANRSSSWRRTSVDSALFGRNVCVWLSVTSPSLPPIGARITRATIQARTTNHLARLPETTELSPPTGREPIATARAVRSRGCRPEGERCAQPGGSASRFAIRP